MNKITFDLFVLHGIGVVTIDVIKGIRLLLIL